MNKGEVRTPHTHTHVISGSGPDIRHQLRLELLPLRQMLFHADKKTL